MSYHTGAEKPAAPRGSYCCVGVNMVYHALSFWAALADRSPDTTSLEALRFQLNYFDTIKPVRRGDYTEQLLVAPLILWVPLWAATVRRKSYAYEDERAPDAEVVHDRVVRTHYGRNGASTETIPEQLTLSWRSRFTKGRWVEVRIRGGAGTDRFKRPAWADIRCQLSWGTGTNKPSRFLAGIYISGG